MSQDTHARFGSADISRTRITLHGRSTFLQNDRLVRDDGRRMQIKPGTDPILPCGERSGARNGRELQEQMRRGYNVATITLEQSWLGRLLLLLLVCSC
jgi:hypothetical protein